MRRTLAVSTAVLACLIAAPAAHAGVFEDLFVDYAEDQKLDACKYNAGDLQQVKGLIGNDLEQYAPDFPIELDRALQQLASGGCKGQPEVPSQAPQPAAPSAGAAPPPPPPEVQLEPAPPAAPPEPPAQPEPRPIAATPEIPTAVQAATRTAAGTSDAPFPLLALAILAGVLALTGLLWGAARWWAWEPAWAQRMRHASAEAGWRASSTWAEFTDYVRFGR